MTFSAVSVQPLVDLLLLHFIALFSAHLDALLAPFAFTFWNGTVSPKEKYRLTSEVDVEDTVYFRHTRKRYGRKMHSKNKERCSINVIKKEERCLISRTV